MGEQDFQGIADVERAVACFARESDVVLAYLFGSVARGKADHLRDVDVDVFSIVA